MSPDQLREWRKGLGLTQSQAAEKLGISPRSMTTYETVGPVPRVVVLACVAISSYSEEIPLPCGPNVKKLVSEQHHDLGENYIVMPQYFVHGAPFGAALKMHLSQDARRHVKSMRTARFYVRSVLDDDKMRYAVPVMIFDDNVEMSQFYTAWA